MKFIYKILCLTLLTACSANARFERLPDHKRDNSPGDGSPVIGEPAAPSNQREGTITSSGGYVYGYQSNPWFLGNVKSVNYCIDMDEENFGPSREEANASIKRAVGLWKTAFSAPGIFPKLEVTPTDVLKLGQQEFNLVACDDSSVDIHFQLGKLTDRQRATLGKPTDYVASAVQTDYDEEQLRGKGFIYVGSEKGELRPESDDLAEDFLSHNANIVLDWILIHELGHVFGLPHQQGSGFPMGKNFCENVVTMKWRSMLNQLVNANWEEHKDYLGYSNYRELQSMQMRDMFSVQGSAKFRMGQGQLRRDLGIDITNDEDALLSMSPHGDLTLTSWTDEYSSGSRRKKRVRELIKFRNYGNGTLIDDAVYMRVSNKQNVIKFSNPGDFDDTIGPHKASYFEVPILSVVQQIIKGEITVLDTGKLIPVSIKSRPVWIGGDDMEMLTGQSVVDGRIVDLFKIQ